jgi:plasmid stabilization system protein ParE
MVKKSVVWTQTAQKQRRAILKYWTVRNGSTLYAEKLIELIKERVEFIAKNPQAGKPTNHSDTREAALGNFSIYYKLETKKVIITAFWDNRQNPKKLIKLL